MKKFMVDINFTIDTLVEANSWKEAVYKAICQEVGCSNYKSNLVTDYIERKAGGGVINWNYPKIVKYKYNNNVYETSLISDCGQYLIVSWNNPEQLIIPKESVISITTDNEELE